MKRRRLEDAFAWEVRQMPRDRLRLVEWIVYSARRAVEEKERLWFPDPETFTHAWVAGAAGIALFTLGPRWM